MYVEMMVNECDFTGKKYTKSVMGGGAVAKGATGRYCVVMYCGPEWLEENGITPMPIEEAREKADADPKGFADF